MLNGDIQILDDLRLSGDDVDELIGDLVGIEVVQPNPLDAVDGAQLGQQLCQRPAAVQVQAITGDILGHHDEFFHPGFRQVAGFFQDLFLRTAAEPTPDEGDDTEGAAVVTALSNAQPSPII